MQPVEIDFGRHNPGVDPQLHIWGWEIPAYLFLGGMVAGLMVLTAAVELRGDRPRSWAMQLAPFGALGLISLGMGALFLDLAHKLYVWRFYLAFRPASPMSWGAWILLLVYPALAIQGLGGLDATARGWLTRTFGARAGWALGQADEHRTPVLWATLAVGVSLGVYTGLLLGTVPARLLWNSAALGPLVLASGVSTAAALLLLLPLTDDERHRTAKLDVAAMLAEVVLLGIFLVGLASGGTPQRSAAHALLGGEYTAPFWALVVLLGLATPLALNAAESWLRRPATRLAPLLVLIGGYSLRAIVVAAGQHSSFALLP